MADSLLPTKAEDAQQPQAPGRQIPPEPLWRHLLGERLRRARHERGDTLEDIARRAGVSPQYLSEIERGLKEPSSEMIAAVMGALGITLVDLTLDIAERLIATQQPAQPVSLRQSTVALAA
ncbi:helix-turn-helix domain-containing protein [Microbacterium sp. NPDC058021]|uniref:helix-turn-helix domain-containing protein n=1 Tax=Microbacterium sp. NPDC058021 TaxID=3346306 RepID=UPI0036DEBE41